MPFSNFWFAAVILLAGLTPVISTSHEDYNESLRVKPLPNGKQLISFDFKIRTAMWGTSSIPMEETQHYRLFPLPLAQLLQQHDISELHLTLNAGKWNQAQWGHQDVASTAGGAELWAWISMSDSDEDLTSKWQALTNGLSGLFCASLGSLDHRRATRPRAGFRPVGLLLDDRKHDLMHAMLPSEGVCTENLTPFVKMLPCKTRSGIASLLNPHRIFDTDWHGLSIQVYSPQQGTLELELTVHAVMDPVRLSLHGLKDWSFSSIFGGAISQTCLAASSAWVKVHSPIHDPFSVIPRPSIAVEGVSAYNLSIENVPLDIRVNYQNPYVEYGFSTQAPLPIHRVLHGGLGDGTLAVHIHNSHSAPLDVLWVESLPWFIVLYLHTLSLRVNGIEKGNLFQLISYETPNDNSQSSTLFEALIHLPAKSTVEIQLNIHKSSILYTEHPPDASRGWDLPPAIFFLPGGEKIYTTTLLAELPTPDFSMPYNVIIMTSTLLALFFGSVMNTVTRSFGWIPS
ncbi:Gpi16 subunit, GPI transamidase component [Clavulina sp. PMI_390]|nr:Gpi16 subunit, GPI transamidase component [Clavulina sp. PMI_390]